MRDPLEVLTGPFCRAILMELRTGPKTTKQLSAAIPVLARPTVSHHIAALLKVGLVYVDHHQGTFTYYALNKETIRQVISEIDDLIGR